MLDRMKSRCLLTSADAAPLGRLFAPGEAGCLSFGIADTSENPATTADLLAGEVRFRAYVMEGFVTYFLSASERPEGLVLHVRAIDSPRSAHLDWLIKQQAESEGCNVRDSAA